jgi:hypothetical protein
VRPRRACRHVPRPATITVAVSTDRYCRFGISKERLERAKGFEPSTPTLATLPVVVSKHINMPRRHLRNDTQQSHLAPVVLTKSRICVTRNVTHRHHEVVFENNFVRRHDLA